MINDTEYLWLSTRESACTEIAAARRRGDAEEALDLAVANRNARKLHRIASSTDYPYSQRQ
jgi:hypothetical protein